MAFAERKKREREERRNEIIDAAEKLFFTRDYDSVSMDEIAKEVGVNKALIYYYFKNKETLYFAIVLRAARLFDDMMEKSIRSHKTGVKKLKAIGRAVFDFSLMYPGYYQIYFYSGSRRFNRHDTEYSGEIKELSRKAFIRPCEVIEEGLQDGTIRKGVNPPEVSLYLATVSEGIAMMNDNRLKVLELQGVDRERFMQDVLDFLENGLKAD